MVNDYSKLFNENMSSFEARNVFWNAAENISKPEREKIFKLIKLFRLSFLSGNTQKTKAIVWLIG